MASDDEKVRENRLRRMAERQGFAVKKSRRRDQRAIDYGEMWLLRERVQGDSGRWELVASPEQTHDAWVGPFDSLDSLEEHLTGDMTRVGPFARLARGTTLTGERDA